VLRAAQEGELLLADDRDHRGSVQVSVAPTATASRGHRPPAETTWSELHDRLRAFVARRVPDRAAVDDLAQEIMLRLYTSMARLRDRDRLDAWAYQVARNVIADYWRDRAATRELPLDQDLSDRLAAMPALEDDHRPEQLRAEIASCLAPMVERLAEPYREAIRLTDLGARTQTEAAAQLGLSVPGMKARVQRGRAQLRELLLACCRIELDRRGQITEIEHAGSSGTAACGCDGGRS
jgi:RNA polymerase sigma-70 factor (ECF subfamily)